MKLIQEQELTKVAGLQKFGGDVTSRLLMQVLQLNKINQIYSEAFNLDAAEFMDYIINRLGITFDYNPVELARIPKKGSFIIVANHPFGGLDGIILIKLITQIRPDFKVMANFLLQRIEPLQTYFFGVNPFEQSKDSVKNFSGIKQVLKFLEDGNSLGIFPAGEVSNKRGGHNLMHDREWQTASLKLIRKAKVPIIPIFFNGSNSALFKFLSKIHPMLQTAKLPSELLNKRNKIIKVRIGNPIPLNDQEKFTDIAQYGRFLRLKTYALSGTAEIKHNFFLFGRFRNPQPQDIINPVSKELLTKEIEGLREDCLLFNSNEYSIFAAPYNRIPNLMIELGRLREKTFREVGEGTNHSMDIDEFDLYYDQMFIWDNKNQIIIGAYRFGKGHEILSRFGVQGFYVNTLFKIRKGAFPMLNQTIEMGRSFIIKEYQTKPLSLFLLWKGIFYYLLRHPEYNYLLGTVSISNSFSSFSKELIVEFVKENFSNSKLEGLFEPRNPFKTKLNKELDKNLALQFAEHDINRLDRFIQDMEANFGIPVLIKKYIQQKASIIAFNVDPDFNNCLDGLMIVDIFDFPSDVVRFYLKDLDPGIYEKKFNLELGIKHK